MTTRVDIDYPFKFVKISKFRGQYTLPCYDEDNKGNILVPPTVRALDGIKEGFITTERFENWHKQLIEKQALLHVIKNTIPSTIYDERLYSHQQTGVHFINAVTNRALLWDDPRVGKTPQAIVSLFGDHADVSKTLPALIVCPKDNVSSWSEEVFNWCGSDFSFEGLDIINWQSLHKLPEKKYKSMIIDEAHLLKNRKSKVFNKLKRIKSDNLLLLTATPIEKPEQLYNYAHLLYPKQFTSFWRWVRWFCNWHEDYFGIKITGSKEEALPVLQDLMNQFSIRRKITDVIQGSDVNVKPRKIKVNLHPTIQHYYDKLEDRKMYQIEDLGIQIKNQTSRRYKQIQLVSNPEKFDLAIWPNKLTALIQIIEASFGQVIVFCSHVETIKLIEEILPSAVGYYSGTSDEAFVNGDRKVLVTNYQMGAEGKDYSFADKIVLYELPMPISATKLKQAMARTIKIGVNENPQVEVLVSCKLEEEIYSLLERKMFNIEQVELEKIIE